MTWHPNFSKLGKKLMVSLLAGGGCMIGTSAHAAVPIAAMMPLSLQLVSQPSCIAGIGSTPTIAAALTPSTKASAILGGAPSKLEQIRLQQLGVSSVIASDTQSGKSALATEGQDPLRSLRPAAGGERLGLDCNPLGGLSAAIALPLVSSQPSRYSSEDFLASKRIAIKRTMFDRDWSRVQNEKLSRSQLIQATPSHEGLQMISDVNRWVNKTIRFEEDEQLFGRSDYWAGARKTLRLRKGDCEDIALVKMQMLAAAGIPRSDMTLTIARDLVRKADHALLIVKYQNRYLLLDNSTEKVLDASYSYDYRPVLSLSAGQAWLHGY